MSDLFRFVQLRRGESFFGGGNARL